jgi:hypothetical protein
MRFVIDQNNDGEFHWRLTGDDGADLAVSPAPEDNPVLLSTASGLG